MFTVVAIVIGAIGGGIIAGKFGLISVPFGLWAIVCFLLGYAGAELDIRLKRRFW